jgi:hypothetical protein
MTVNVIGSYKNQETIDGLNILLVHGVKIRYKDIMVDKDARQEYVKMMGDKAYTKDLKKEITGTPCYVCEDGSMTLNIDDVLSENKRFDVGFDKKFTHSMAS